mgnify:FL=1
MILSKEELMTEMKSIIGERTDDEAIKFIEDVTDTIGSLEEQNNENNENNEWKSKYEEIVTKYKERFFNQEVDKNEETEEETKEETEDNPETYDELFEEED